MEEILSSKKFHKFCCNSCDYYTSRKSQFERHLITSKHLTKTNDYKIGYEHDKKVLHDKYLCKCGKKYKYRQGLWKHMKICKFKKSSESSIVENDDDKDTDDEDTDDKTELKMLTELVKDVIKHNQELTNKIIDLCKSPSTGNSISHSNVHSNNKTFNLQFFLNETCKDAMNISDFVESIKFQIKDLEHVGEVGFVEGISDVVLDNLTELDTRQRPIHCSDQKREILYIKDNDEWIKDDEPNTRMSKVIKQIAHKNMKVIPEWVKNNPDCHNSSSKKNDKYLKIVSNSMSGGTEMEQKTNISKIISKVAKEVTIDKNKYQQK
jgi:hypothetical protein